MYFREKNIEESVYINKNQSQHLSDKIDNSYYNTLYEISKLFKNKNFKSKIGSKADPNSVAQIIIFYNPINITEEFILDIHNKYYITITVPLKNSNFYYTTTINNIEDIYNYIKLHL